MDSLSKRMVAQLRFFEGVEYYRYFDTKGIPTVGVGFNLNRSDAKIKINALGLDFVKVYSGLQPLNDEQINTLLLQDIAMATHDARKWIDNFDSLSDIRKRVAIDMAYNMGYATLSQFVNTKKYIEMQKYDRASVNMTKSAWFAQVKHRGIRLAAMMLTGVDLIP